VSKRAGAILVDGCGLDNGQQSSLMAGPAKAVASQVIFRCLSLQDDGSIGLRNGATQMEVSSLITTLRAQGYKVTLAVTAVDGQDQDVSAAHLRQLLADATWRDKTVQSLGPLAQLGDGLEVALPTADDASRPDVSSLVAAIKTQLAGQRPLGVFVPPSIMQPSDIPGGNAYDVSYLAAHADRLRVMTLDFSCCVTGAPPGPTMDAEWAAMAARQALGQAGATPIDIAMPLYGTDFTLQGTGQGTGSAPTAIGHSFVNYDEAIAAAAQYQVTPQRGPGDAPYFDYRDEKGAAHEVWYDDSLSTLQTLSAWTPGAVPLSVGVVYYALGAEDPTLWANIEHAQR
jgi:spore germination protein YaaH